MTDTASYMLYGYLNLFCLIPDFVYPIYLSGNNFYFADGDGWHIEHFVKVKASYRNRITPLPATGFKEYRVGSPQIYIYIQPGNKVLIGTGPRMCGKLRGYQPGDQLLQEDLTDFLSTYDSPFPSNRAVGTRLRYRGTGRRKTAVARVYLREGNGRILVNRRDFNEYFVPESLQQIVLQPFVLTGTTNRFDVFTRVSGGGFSGQAGAIRHGISRALLQSDAAYRPVLKKAGLLTRDSRMKERKKPGLKAARRAPQYAKR